MPMDPRLDAVPCDDVLFLHAKAGSEQALTQLAEQHYESVFQFLVKRTYSHELARDLTQETFLDMTQSLESIPTDRPLRAWLMVTARNNLLHWLRQERIRSHASFDQIMQYSLRPPRQLALDDPALRLIDNETLRAILDELSPNLRDVLILMGKGYSIKEAAETLDIDYQAARQRVSRGMRYVRKRYVELGIFPEEHR